MAKSEIQIVQLSSRQQSYPIIIGQDLLQSRSLLQDYVQAKQILVVTSKTVAKLYLSQVKAAFGDRCDEVILEDGEFYKNHDSLEKIYESLIKKNYHRDCCLIALGGGVVGDITGFAASTYQRGVDFIQIPTTLLAQVDASIGGKTAINFLQAKNMIGSFYQPRAVLIDLSTLATLAPRELNAGFAEIIKYAILDGAELFSKVAEFLKGERSAHLLRELISQSCRIKASIVQKDEFENSERALLNLGHTFAHALESISNYQRWLHGEAVGIGLYCAALLSVHFGMDASIVEQIDEILSLAELPRRIPKDIDLLSLREMFNNDKKVKANQLRFILIKSLGNCYIKNGIMDDVLQEVLQAAKEGE